MSEFKKYLINLQLFGEGGDGAGDGGSAEGTTDFANQTTKRGAKNPLSNVRYGIQGEDTHDTGADTVTTPTIDRSAKFDELIKGEYKDLYDAKVQDIVQKRLKGSKETVDKYNALSPLMEMLGRKYGVDHDDADALVKAIQDDDSYYEDEALEKGISVETLKDIKKMERENAELKAQMDQQRQKENADRIYADWMAQEQAAKQKYPSLDLKVELQNPQFLSLLRSGIDVDTAYTVIHKDEIIPAAMQYASNTATKMIANKVASGANRPSENAISAKSSALVKDDVSKLSKADRQEIIRRVAAGEKIRF